MLDTTIDPLIADCSVPLCVDLDGTLITGDMLKIGFEALVSTKPWTLGLMACWLALGKANLKAEIARRVVIDPASLTYNRPFLDWLRGQRQCGRRLWLCTGTHEKMASAIAGYLRLFDGVLATSDTTNLTGSKKAEVLRERFGERGFDYCGNEMVDLPVWAICRRAVVVNASPNVLGLAKARGNVVLTF